jgi:hypothetical protein
MGEIEGDAGYRTTSLVITAAGSIEEDVVEGWSHKESCSFSGYDPETRDL